MNFIIIGNGITGVTAAKSLSDTVQGENSIKIFTEEKFTYYYKPKLPMFLGDDSLAEKDLQGYDFEWYKEKGIELHLNEKVNSIDPKNKVIVTINNTYSFDKLLLATGAECFVPPLKGSDLDNFYDLRTLTDAIKIKNRLEKSKSVGIIGGGILGLETANSCSNRGLEVNVIEYFPYLLPRQLDQDGGTKLQKILEKRGIKFFLGAQIEKIIGKDVVENIQLKDGTNIKTDLALVCAGIKPRKQLAESAGIECNKGIIVNNYLETNKSDIFAAGDCAEHNHIIYGIIPPSTEQARIAASNMIKPRKQVYSGSKFSATLKISDIYLTSFGKIKEIEIENCIILKYENKERTVYVKLFLSDNILQGAIILGTKSGIPIIRQAFNAEEEITQFKTEINKIFPNLVQ